MRVTQRETEMKEALIVLTLLGCDDTGARCQHLSVENERFETREACILASNALLRETDDEDYPLIMARCSEPVAVADNADEILDAASDVQIEPFPPVDETPAVGHVRWVTVAVQAVPGRRELRDSVMAFTDGTAAVGASIVNGVGRVASAINPF